MFTTKKPDNSLTYGNIPDDFCCPSDCPYLESYPCDECLYDDYLRDEEMARADEKYDAWVDSQLDDMINERDDKET